MNIIELAKFTEDQARAYLEELRWPAGPVCPRCGHKETIYRLEGKSHRAGMLKCGECREPFSATVGTVMESSHVPLTKWLVAFHLMASSKKGISAHQLHRTLGVTYKSAWFMAHRIRHAMTESGNFMLGTGENGGGGIVEVDETFVGGKPPKIRWKPMEERKVKWRRMPKVPVVALIDRDGKARATVMHRVTGPELREFMKANIDSAATIMTDESPNYRGTKWHFAGHETVNHSRREYGRGNAHVNTAESFFALLKRSHYGTFHHLSRKHLHRYVAELTFRWNRRKVTDEERRDSAIKGIEGKRITYREGKMKLRGPALSR